MPGRFALFAGLALTMVMLPGHAGAQEVHNLNTGRLLASNCTQCHATNALPKSAGYDSLVGKSYYDIYGELKEMAQKFNASTHACTESDPKECLMAVHAKPYTDQEMQDIAWYLSQP